MKTGLAGWLLASPCWVWAATLTATPGSILSALVLRLQPGDVLQLEPGVYRQTLALQGVRGRPDAPIVIDGQGAIIRGSNVLKDWKVSGPGLYRHALPQETSMVFVDGRALQQMGGTVFDGFPLRPTSSYHGQLQKEGGVWPGRKPDVAPQDLPPESFWYDRDQRQVYLRSATDPRQVTTEASVRTRTVEAYGVSHLQIRNLKVQHANTSVVTRGASMVIEGHDVTLKGISAEWNDLIGLQTKGNDITVMDSQAHHNGQLGMAARGNRHLIQRVSVQHNNRRLFNKWWEAGGFKFIGDGQGGLRNSVVEDCRAMHNLGDGIWFDWKNRDVTLQRSLAAYNTGFGIHFEASGPGMLLHNIAIGNGQRGIYVSSSRMTQVSHNLAVGNGMEGITAVLEDRKDDEGVPFKADGNRFHRNIVAWNQEGAMFIPEDQGERSNFNVFMGEGKGTMFSVEFPSVFRRPAWGLEAWNAKSGQDRQSWALNRPMPDAWQRYLASASTDRALISQLIREARKAPPSEFTSLGADHRERQLRLPIVDVGPDWIP